MSAATVHPTSEWATGKDWMKMTYEEIVGSGKVRKVSDIKLDHEEKKKLDEGLIFEEEYVKEVKGFIVKVDQNSIKKVIQCEMDSQYIYPPLKYQFRRTVRTYACILIAVLKFKKAILKFRNSKGLDVKDELAKINQPEVKFRYFNIETASNDKLRNYFHVQGFVTKPEKLQIANQTKLETRNKKYFSLSEEELSEALEYLFKKTTEEVLRNMDSKKVAKIGELNDQILYYKGRIMDQQTLKAVCELEDIIDVGGFLGFNFHVPIVYRYSPLALSIASHIHYNIVKHRGLETSYRLSMNYVHILQGRAVFRQIIEDCVKCLKMRKQCTEVEMGFLLTHKSQYLRSIFSQ